jgi:para-aminobenzoate synthetase component 1
VRRTLRAALPPHQLIPLLDPAPGTCAFDAAGPEGWGTRCGGTGSPVSILASEPVAEFRGGLDALAAALAWLAPGRGRKGVEAMLAGAFAYDLGRSFEPLPDLARDDLGLPTVWLAAYRALYRYDPLRLTGEVVGSDPRAVARLHDRIRSAAADRLAVPVGGLPQPHPSRGRRGFIDGVARIQEWIRAGDVYQVNLSRRVELGPLQPRDPAALYGLLTERAGAPFSAFLDAGDFRVVSNSPERFLRVEGNRVETRPIKGTRPRGTSPEEDRWLAKDLLNSAKDRAEHVMIVDLERNDLGRVCATGSVHVEYLAELRSYATVHHLVSSVQGRLAHALDLTGLLRATFPGGSITGAPKIRAMQIIECLEPVRRGIYTGSLGWLDAAGNLDLSIAIRTAVARRDRLYLHLGGGIVADSVASDELRETEDKGLAFAQLCETGP